MTARRTPATRSALVRAVLVLLVVLAAAQVTLRFADGLGRSTAPATVTTSGVQPETYTYIDFRDATYLAVRDLVEGGNPYDAPAYLQRQPAGQELDLYLPLHLLTALPLAALDYRSAAWVWFGLMLGLTGLLAWVSALVVGVRPRAEWALGATVLLLQGQPGRLTLLYGQITPEVAVGVLLALWWSRRRPVLAGLAFTLALIKPQYGLPLGVLLVGVGRWRPVALGTAVGAVASLPVVAVLVARSGGVGGFVASLQRNLDYATSTPYAALDSPTSARVDLAAVLVRVAHVPASALLETLLTLGLLGTAVLVLRRLEDRGRGLEQPLALSLAVLVVLAAIVHQPGDLVLLVPLLLAVPVAGGPAEGLGTAGRWALAGVLLLPAVLVYRVLAVAPDVADVLARTVPGLSLTVALLLVSVAAVRAARTPVGAPAPGGAGAAPTSPGGTAPRSSA